ncbi:MAG: hypothetical protein ACHREM_00635 [Polyangiales bacterium]
MIALAIVAGCVTILTLASLAYVKSEDAKLDEWVAAQQKSVDDAQQDRDALGLLYQTPSDGLQRRRGMLADLRATHVGKMQAQIRDYGLGGNAESYKRMIQDDDALIDAIDVELERRRVAASTEKRTITKTSAPGRTPS